MDLSFDMALDQKQTLSQAQLRSLEILAMDSGELNRMLYDEYLENPMLEYSGKEYGPVETQGLDRGEMPVPFYSHGEDLNEKNDGNIPAPDKDTVRSYLLWQLDKGRYSPKEWAAIEYMADCLDDSGFFSGTLQEAAKACNITEEAAGQCLKDLRELEPWGVFSSDLRECLLKQLQMQGQENTNLWKIVDGYLEAVAAGRISQISRGLGLSTAEIRKCIQRISLLNPRPLAGFGTERAHYIVPDVILKKENGQWQGELNDKWIEDYRINDYYLKMMKEASDEELISYFKGKAEKVQFLMASIQQRRKTILALADLMMERQAEFFEGKGPLKPMTMSEAAEILGIHPSTVSRTAKGKYLQYPGGSVPMKSLFSASTGREDVSSMGIRQRIRELIEKEDKKKPLSDKKIAELLEGEGMTVSRRFVAKCRDEMMIKGSFERKI